MFITAHLQKMANLSFISIGFSAFVFVTADSESREHYVHESQMKKVYIHI